MNTLEKKIDYIDFAKIPELVYSGAKFKCYIVNYNLPSITDDYPLDSIVKFIDDSPCGGIDYEDYIEYLIDHSNVNGFFAQDKTFLGFLIIETENTILVKIMWTDEISDVVWDCFIAFSELADNKCKTKISAPTESLKSKSLSSIDSFFRFMSLL
jgi:hypothetical protein